MKILTSVFPITLGRPVKNAEEMIKTADERLADIYLFPAYALGGVSCGKLQKLPSFISETEKAVKMLCDYTKNNEKVIVTATAVHGNIAIYGGKVDKSGTFTKNKKTVLISQSANVKADIILIPMAMPSYPCIKNDICEYCAAISKTQNCTVAVANAGYGESVADDVFKGFCGILRHGVIVSFMGEDKPEKIIAEADYEKTDGIIYARPNRLPGKIPYYTKNDKTIFISEMVQLQKQAVYTRIKALKPKKIFIDGEEKTETLFALRIISDALKDAKTKPEKTVVFTKSDVVSAYAKSYGFLTNSEFSDEERIKKAEISEKAEKEGGFFIGTRCLSDIAYKKTSLLKENLCHYNVNATLPKTVLWDAVRYLYTDDKKVEKDVEKLCKKEEKESLTYFLFDFFLFYFARHNSTKEDLKNYAKAIFTDVSEEEIEKSLEKFITNYKKNQQIRSALPEGANILGFNLPYIPTEADYDI